MKRTLIALIALTLLPLAAIAGVADRSITVNSVVYKETVAQGDTYSVTVQPPDLAASWTLTWPTTAGTNHNSLHTDGAGASSWSMVALTTDVSGTLPIANGGTGQTTANTALNALLPSQGGNSGKVLGTDATNASWVAALTTTLTNAHLFVGDGTNTAVDVAVSGDVTLANTGAFTIGSAKVTVAKGGTGLSSGTSGGIPYFNASTTMASSAALTANGVVLGGGAGATPTATAACTAANQVLRSGSPPACGALVAADLPAASSSAAGSVSYEDSGNLTISLSGPRTITNETWHYTRTGKNVCISIPRNVGASCSAAAFTSGNDAIPAALQPAFAFGTPNQVLFPIFVQNNAASATTVGVISIQSSTSATHGKIEIDQTAAASAFTNAANCGYFESSICYTVQ